MCHKKLGYDIFDCKAIVIPINITRHHWLCIVAHISEQDIALVVYDSLNASSGFYTQDFVARAVQYLKDAWEWKEQAKKKVPTLPMCFTRR